MLDRITTIRSGQNPADPSPAPVVSGSDGLDATALRRVLEARVARLATVRPDGRPHVVPITFALNGQRIVSAIDHKPKTTTNLQRLKNIEATPFASIVVDRYDEDWSGLWWVRADGNARIVQEGYDHESAVGWLAEKYAAYRDRPPRGPVIVLDVQRWSTWSA